jgi:hypothetical protein
MSAIPDFGFMLPEFHEARHLLGSRQIAEPLLTVFNACQALRNDGRDDFLSPAEGLVLGVSRLLVAQRRDPRPGFAEAHVYTTWAALHDLAPFELAEAIGDRLRGEVQP